MTSKPSQDGKLQSVAHRIVELLMRRPELRQTDIASALGERDSTIMRALPVLEAKGIRLAEDDRGRISMAE